MAFNPIQRKCKQTALPQTGSTKRQAQHKAKTTLLATNTSKELLYFWPHVRTWTKV